jgi:membrane associated rhomboid family serine protease
MKARCPNCNIELEQQRGPTGVYWECTTCQGRSSTIALLRRSVPRKTVNAIWQTARGGLYPRKRRCVCCTKDMIEVPIAADPGSPVIDICTCCQVVWFDAAEYSALPKLAAPDIPFDQALPPEAREKLAMLQLAHIENTMRDSTGSQCPDTWWACILSYLGLPVEEDNILLNVIPWGTWACAAAMTVITGIALFDLEETVAALGLIPSEPGRLGGLTFITSFFLHGGIFHLLGNLYFLVVFGDNVENWLGHARFILLLAIASLVGDMAHIIVDPRFSMPLVGASGGISGILAFYACQFPHSRLKMAFRFYFTPHWFTMPAYVLFLFWILLQLFGVSQQLGGMSNVSALAHLGGALTGFIFWVILRNKDNRAELQKAHQRHWKRKELVRT